MAVTADRVIVELEAKLDQYKRDLAAGERKFDTSMKNIRKQAGLTEAQTTKSFNAMGRASKQMGDSLRNAALALATVAGAGAGVRVLADFAQAMSTVKAVSQATESQFVALESAARDLGASTRFSATQAAEGMLFLARAGFDVNEILGSIEGTLKLAQAGNMDLGRAADIASNVLQGFRLEVAETARVVDVLALAANSSNTDVSQLGEAMKYAAPIAAGLGIGVEDTAAAVSALSDAGLQGQMAGTGLRRVMIGLEKQSSQGEKVLKKYGLTMQDIALDNTGSLAESLNRLAEAGINTADAMTLFGLRGGPAFEVLQSSIPKIRELTDAYEGAGGTAERIAEVMDANLNGALLATKSRLEELILALGDAGAEDGLIIALESLQKLLVVAAENADILAVALVALTIRALVPMAAAALGSAAPALATLSTSLQLLTVRGGAALVATRALAGAMTLLNPATLIIAAAAGAFIALARETRNARKVIDDAREAIDAMNAALARTDKYATFENLQDDATFTIPVMERLRNTIEGVAEAIQSVTSASLVQELSALNTEIQNGQAALDELRAQREKEVRRIAENTGDESRAAQVIDDSELGQSILQAEQKVAALQKRLRDSTRVAFGDASVNLVDAFREGGIEAVERALNQRFTEITNAGVIEKELENVKALTASLEDAKGKGLDRAAARFEEQIAIAEETISLLQSGIDEATARQLATETVRGQAGGSGGLDKQTKKTLDEIRSAYQDTFETEREQIDRIRDERLAAIDAATIGEAKAAELRQQANDVHAQQLRDLRAQEAEDFDAYLDEQQAKIDAERNLVAEITRARDEMLGRTATLLEREYDLKRAQIDKEIEDATRKHEAIAALDEEYAARRQELEDKALGNGQFSDSEVERIRAVQEEKLELLDEWYALNLEKEQEYLDRRKEINAEAEAAITQIKQEAAVAQLDAAERGFDAAADLAKKFAGENKGIYKALFLAEKAAALGSAYVQMNLAVAKAAAAAPPPANAPLIAAAKATGLATIAGIAASAITGFRDGVVKLDGQGGTRSDSIPAMLSRDESVMTADATRKNESLLRLMNQGVDVEAQLARIQQPVAITPSFFTSGGRNVTVGGAQLNFNGPVDRDTIPDLRAMVESLSREQEDRIRAVIAEERTQTTPRNKRPKLFR